jgi:hypothetical protein
VQIRSPVSESLQVSEPPMLRAVKRVTSQDPFHAHQHPTSSR